MRGVRSKTARAFKRGAVLTTGVQSSRERVPMKVSARKFACLFALDV
jgi:hypothetical protein